MGMCMHVLYANIMRETSAGYESNIHQPGWHIFLEHLKTALTRIFPLSGLHLPTKHIV